MPRVGTFGKRRLMGLSTAMAAGAVICGAYFGDKMSPLSETTILVPQLVGGGLHLRMSRKSRDKSGPYVQ